MAIKSGTHCEKKGYGPSKKDKNKVPPTKVVIRRLPPDMTDEIFHEQVSPLPEHDYVHFVPADLGLGPHAFSRAYINLVHLKDVVVFRDRFDGYIFVDKQGFEFPAIVEFAPYQRTPRRRARKPDAKCGTIADDADYRAFLEAAERPADSPPPSWEATLEEIEKRHMEMKENQAVTPLVTFVVRRRAEKKEERRRRELDRRTEDTLAKKINKDRRDSERERHEEKETTSRVIWNEQRDKKYGDTYYSKKYDEKAKDKHGKYGKNEKEEKYDRRKEKGDKKWKDSEKTKRDEKLKEREERRTEIDWDDRRKRSDKKHGPTDSSSESYSGRSRDSESRGGRGKDSQARAGRRGSESHGGRCRESESYGSWSGQDSESFASHDKDSESRRTKEGSSHTGRDRESVSARQVPAAARGDGDGTRTTSERTTAPEGGQVATSTAKDSQRLARQDETKRKSDSKVDRRIKNKDRPALAIYRPGMGKYSSRRLQERDPESASPTPAAAGGEGEDDERQRRTLVFRRSRATDAE